MRKLIAGIFTGFAALAIIAAPLASAAPHGHHGGGTGTSNSAIGGGH